MGQIGAQLRRVDRADGSRRAAMRGQEGNEPLGGRVVGAHRVRRTAAVAQEMGSVIVGERHGCALPDFDRRGE
jgi:hypothetical protein